MAKAAQVYLGDAGLYLAGAIAGLTDVDAIALSMAQLARGDPANADAAARTIVIAVALEHAVQGRHGGVPRRAELRRAIAPAVVVILAAGAAGALLFF